MRGLVVFLGIVLSVAACASSGRTGAATPRSNPDVITAEQIAATHVQNAYDAVSQIRPRFLATQGGTTLSHAVRVIVDDVPRGGVSVLRSINASDIVEIRHLSAADATMRWGTGYTGGAIVVKTLASARK